MDEYKRANGDIRAPEGLKERAAGGERRRPRARWYAAVAAALAVTVALTAVLWPAGNSAALAIYEAEYPQAAAYPQEPQSRARPPGSSLTRTGTPGWRTAAAGGSGALS